MTLTQPDHLRPTCDTVRAHRRFAVVTDDRLDGMLRVATLLRQRRYDVAEFAADVREGVGPSTVTCTVSVTPDERDLLVERLRRIPSVLAVDTF